MCRCLLPYLPAAATFQGADIIKVESLSGAGERGGSPVPLSAADAMVNRNKRSISIDLKTKEGVALLLKLAADADGEFVLLSL